MYKVELIERDIILTSKELKDYESTFNYLETILKELEANRKIIVYEKRSDKWGKFGEWKLQ
ncbi:MAG: hypothetical protein ACRCZO_11340 [Cetobacterium sp.]